MNKRIDWTRLITSVLLAESIGLIGTVFTTPNIEGWYQTLAKPVFSPPNWLFGPVWLGLYFLIGLAIYQLWSLSKTGKAINTIRLFAFHLFLNAAWSPVFFGRQQIAIGLAILLVMDLSLVVCLQRFKRLNLAAWWYLLPYLAWILFASLLNGSLLLLN